MHSRVTSIIEFGLEGTLVDVECNITNGLPGIVIVGYANRSVDEARERIRAAFMNSGLQLPRRRVALNLAPGDIPKDGTSYDLAMAMAILLADKQTLRPQPITLFIGELGLDGSLRPVRGLIGKVLAARKLGYKDFVVPISQYEQVRLIPNVTIHPAHTLAAVAAWHLDGVPLPPVKHPSAQHVKARSHVMQHLNEIAGQERAKRALHIAAAGRHNMLLLGPPGTGKSMLAKTLPGLLPNLTPEEQLEVTHLHSLVESHYSGLIAERPFRAPHHSASTSAITGGGAFVRPGEISLSHHGVLFLDELPEFRRDVLEALRQPLEERAITVHRARHSVRFPADCMVVATANPCPCGFYGTEQACSCSLAQRLRYQQRLSGPILDRIDMVVQVDPVPYHQLHPTKKPHNETSHRIKEAYQVQLQRQNGQLNSSLTPSQLKKHAPLGAATRKLLDTAAQKLGLSARGYHKTIKVARTIADLENSPDIEQSHLAEALQYRQQP